MHLNSTVTPTCVRSDPLDDLSLDLDFPSSTAANSPDTSRQATFANLIEDLEMTDALVDPPAAPLPSADPPTALLDECPLLPELDLADYHQHPQALSAATLRADTDDDLSFLLGALEILDPSTSRPAEPARPVAPTSRLSPTPQLSTLHPAPSLFPHSVTHWTGEKESIFRDPESALVELVEERVCGRIFDAIYGISTDAQGPDSDWRPPEGNDAPNRLQPSMPDLEGSLDGGIIVAPSCLPTYAAGVLWDDQLRLTAAHARSLPREERLIFLAPAGFAHQPPLSLKSRWQTARVMLNPHPVGVPQGVRPLRRALARIL